MQRDPGGASAGSSLAHEVVVRVLGPVDVIGAARPFRRAWTIELVTYLAMHPEGATADRWAEALWPDRVLSDATRHSTASDARRALGLGRSGCQHLPRSNGYGVYRLAPTVTTDWARFSWLAARIGPSAPAAWRNALDLVRGRPFDGLRADDWTVLEGIAPHVEDAIVTVALDLADYELASGEPRRAELAARRALLASPYDERLYRVLLRAADAQGNPAGVESTMSALVRALGGASTGPHSGARRRPPAPADVAACVHPDTATLYCSLSRRTQQSLRVALG